MTTAAEHRLLELRAPVRPRGLSVAQVESVAPRSNPLQEASGLRMRSVSMERLRRELEDQEALEHFDLTDPECPVAIRRCRSCKVVLRFEFPGGVVPLLMRYLLSVACESCAEEERAAEERGRGQAERGKRLAKSGIADSLAKAVSWESLILEGGTPDATEHRRRAIDAAKEWAASEQPKRGLLLWGPPGTGKTRLAATAAVARMEHSAITWVSVGVLMAELDGAWNDEERKKALKVLTSPGPVVLDDIDKIQPNARMRGQIFTALDKREQSGQALIVTANGTPKQLGEQLGEAVASRLMGMCSVLHYPGPDHRLELGV